MQYHAIPCNTMHYHAIPCNAMQYHAISCNTMHYHAIPCNIMQYYAIQCNTMQYHASLITADGAYHCPLGSIMAIFPYCPHQSCLTTIFPSQKVISRLCIQPGKYRLGDICQYFIVACLPYLHCPPLQSIFVYSCL